MTQFLPPNLLALFAPRDPIPYLPPADKLTHEKKRVPYMGIAQYTHLFEDPKDTPPPTRAETREERRERKRREKAEQVAYKLEQEIAVWDPHSTAASTMDPFKTLFIARINYDTSESKLRREFEVYGAVRKIVMVHDKRTGKPRGYAFIEYEHERDMHSAYKHADGKKIDGRRVLVDVERARTVKGWLPRRLGGGLGGTRRGGPEVNVKHSGREDNERERQRYLDRERDRENGRDGREGREGRERDYRPPLADRGDRDRDRERDRDRDRDRDRVEKKRSRSRDRDRERRKRSRSRDRKRARRSEERMDASLVGSDSNVPASMGDERRREKDRDKDRRERRDRDKDRGKDREKDRDKERDRKRSRRSRSRERRDKDKERDRRDYPREDMGDQIRVKEEPPDEYEQYPPQGYEEDYSNYDPNNVKYEGDESLFQSEEY